MDVHTENIKMYINDIRKNMAKIRSWRHLEKTYDTKYALTQLLTNIYESSLETDIEFPRKLAITRRLASHVYQKVDFYIVYNLCKELMEMKFDDQNT